MDRNSRWFRFIVGLDQAFNPLVYGGSEDITISAQTAYRELMLGKSRRTRRVIDWIFARLGDHNHCYANLLGEIDEFEDRDAIRAALAKKGIV